MGFDRKHLTASAIGAFMGGVSGTILGVWMAWRVVPCLYGTTSFLKDAPWWWQRETLEAVILLALFINAMEWLVHRYRPTRAERRCCFFVFERWGGQPVREQRRDFCSDLDARCRDCPALGRGKGPLR